ncbi:MAG: manganese efflux pump [Ruminococcaceae bacterium]|nr:manganese efflux pump [Oscillospiraceae bacterium]
MNWDLMFFLNSALLGVGLAMDAFSVSLANGLNEPKMKILRMSGIAGVFSAFQFLMPLIGWFCVTTFLSFFKSFEKFIPWIALILLLYIGGKMLYDSFSKKECASEECKTGFWALFVQGIATSIDALSVGFTIADHNWVMAAVSALIIGVITFFICLLGLFLGKKFGTHLADKAGLLGGIILIVIGIEIFIKGIV